MRLFLEITKISFQRHLTYREATLAGLVTNFFFGILRASILVALYGPLKEVAEITVQDAITYAALTQALIGYLSIFHWYDLMNSVYTGDISSDLLKPMGLFSFWLAQDLGRAIINFVFRGIVVLIGYSFIFDLVYPKGISQWMALGFSLILSWIISFTWRYLINLASFWTPNARGILRFFFVLSWFFSGFLMPLRFFPDWVAQLANVTPFPHMLNTTIEVYLNIVHGPELIRALIFQTLWAIGLFILGQIILKIGVRRLVILGG
jgi:ABC-2 type transport system permease protein